MKIKQALNIAKARLKDDAKYAEFILLEYIKKDKAYLFLHEDDEIDEKIYFSLINRFISKEPFEYIFKKASFYGLDFKVKKGVLIPRYDSEILLNIILKELKNNKFKNILEIGFGSGILSIIIAKMTNTHIIACDISKTALNIAKKNAKIHKVDHLIDFRLCSFKDIKNIKFDFIFSNPPYIAKDYKIDEWLQKEPKKALFGGIKGYEILKEIILYAKDQNALALACEFGYDQLDILDNILKQNDFSPSFYKDENGFNRAFMARNIRLFDK